MTMKKVLVFLLVLALALGGLGFAHAAVTDSQDDLRVYPTLQVGNPRALEGLTASLTFSCGDHLRWHTDYPFGGEAITEFAYHRKAIAQPTVYTRGRMDLYFAGSVSASVSGGSIPLNRTEYGVLLRAVAAATPQSGSKTMNLRISDYVNYYFPDFELFYEDDNKQCSESANLYGFVSGDHEYENPSSYRNLMEVFRFPVQPDHIISVTLEKDDAGQVTGIALYPENGPELHFLSDVTADGVWFLPMFRDAQGNALPYESPAGHGIYFIPWKSDGIIRCGTVEKETVMLDVKHAQLCFPLAESLQLEHMVIDAEAGTAQMLTREDGFYVLTTCDLENGTVKSRLDVLPQDPDALDTAGAFLREGDYLLVRAQGQIALTDAAGETLCLTAPDAADQTFGGKLYDPDTGDLRFDGETLVLTDNTWYREGTFWAAAWRQGELCFYGEYDCSLMQGNDNWYYSYVTAEEYPIILK